MKLSTCQLITAVLLALLGAGELAISAEENTDAAPQTEGAVTLEDAKKAAANKRPRGVLAESFFWPSAGDANKGTSPATTPAPVVSGPQRPASGVPARPAAFLSEPVLNVPPPPVVEARQPLVQPVAWSMNGPEQQVQQAPPQYVEAPISSGYTCSCTDECCVSDCCPDPMWCHRCGIFGDFLFLRPGNIDYIYAVEQTGTQPDDVPTGPVGRVGFDTTPGYRIGVNQCLCDTASIQFSYTWFQTTTSSSITADGINVLVFQPGVPQIPNVAASSITSSADYAIRFQKIDIDYRGLLYGSCDTAVNYFAGVRYANLEQNFRAEQDVGVAFGLSQVRTDINFDGFGIGFGLDGISRRANTGWLLYGNASANFYAGEFKADYRQTSQFFPDPVAGNTLVDYRVVTVLHTELGLGWRSCCGRVQLTAGYQFEGWFNTLTTGSYIPGVQNRDFSEMIEPISFDGLVARALVQF